MADRMMAHIFISGEIGSEVVLEGLVEAASAAGCLEGNGASIRKAALAAVQAGTVLSLYNYEAAAGELPELEEFCVSHGLAFLRLSDGHYDILPEMHAFSPDGGLHSTVAFQDTWEPLVSLGDLEDALKAGRTLADLVEGTRKCRGEGLPDKLVLAPDLLAKCEAAAVKEAA